MNISDIRTRVDALNDRSCLVKEKRGAGNEKSRSGGDSSFTLVDPRTSDAAMPDPLIQALGISFRNPIDLVINDRLIGSRLRRWHSISFTGVPSARRQSA